METTHTHSAQRNQPWVASPSVVAILVLINKNFLSWHSPRVWYGGGMLKSVGLGQMVPEGIQSRQQGCLVRRAGAGRTEVHRLREQRDLGTRGD